MTFRNVCEILLDVLAEAGAQQIFGVTGDALNPLLEAMRGDKRVEWIRAGTKKMRRMPPTASRF